MGDALSALGTDTLSSRTQALASPSSGPGGQAPSPAETAAVTRVIACTEATTAAVTRAVACTEATTAAVTRAVACTEATTKAVARAVTCTVTSAMACSITSAVASTVAPTTSSARASSVSEASSPAQEALFFVFVVFIVILHDFLSWAPARALVNDACPEENSQRDFPIFGNGILFSNVAADASAKGRFLRTWDSDTESPRSRNAHLR